MFIVIGIFFRLHLDRSEYSWETGRVRKEENGKGVTSWEFTAA